ncbi:MAG TPA: DUF6691 family protein [Kofleriaceae bacterium]
MSAQPAKAGIAGAIIPLSCGALFAAGVCISGMVRPSKVIGFLDFAGAWDASLLLVMASALALHVVAWRIVKQMTGPRYGTAFPGPPTTIIDAKLIGGAALFGIGWGISGFCPGPAIVSLVSGTTASFVFVAAMAAAMIVFDRSGRSDG